MGPAQSEYYDQVKIISKGFITKVDCTIIYLHYKTFDPVPLFIYQFNFPRSWFKLWFKIENKTNILDIE